MASTFRTLTAAAGLLLLAAAAFAAPAAGHSNDVRLDFTVFARNALENIAYFPGGADHPATTLQSYATARSPAYHYKGAVHLAFYDAASAGPDAAPVAVFDIPHGMTKVFLLFTKRSAPTAEGLQYDVAGIDEGRENIPPGSFVILNAAGVTYTGKIGSETAAVPAGVSPAYNAAGGVHVLLHRQDAPGAPAAVSEDFSLKNNERVILVLFSPSSPTGMRPVVRRLQETLPVEPKPGMPKTAPAPGGASTP